MVKEDSTDYEGILIVFDREKERKETEIENFGKKIVDSSDREKNWQVPVKNLTILARHNPQNSLSHLVAALLR